VNTQSLPTTTRIGRPADRQDLIVQELRDQIVAGRLSPGSRLPTRDEIGQKYGAGANTVQRALDRLRRDGFIHSSGRNGTHVSVEPPHLCRYALVFPGIPGYQWVRFWTALSQEAIAFQHESSLQLPAYHGIVGGVENEDLFRLVDDVKNHRVAGLIFMSSPQNLQCTPLLDQPNIPRVAITDYSENQSIPAVGNDNQSLLQRSLQALAASGRKRIAVFHGPGWLSRAEIESAVEAHGFEMRPYWNLRVSLGTPDAAREYAHLLFNSNQRERPDALLIADDNLTEFVLAGVTDAGVKLRKDLSVITHCNFSHGLNRIPDVRRIGFDARAVLKACIDSVDRQRNGLPVDRNVRIPALFENEISYLQES
jgi:DNA-binding LacI/PurR family transcriptional regulator